MKNTIHDVNRRDFLKTGAKFAAATLFMSSGGSVLLGANYPGHTTATIPTVTLSNGVTMPMLGYGTNTLHENNCAQCIADAISVGYRLFDTATIYRNEQFVGDGVRESGIQRDKLFITSKLWVDDSGYESTKQAFQTSLNKLGLEYLDLYLIHRPRGDLRGSWKAMEDLYREGKIRAIGVSNFEPHQLDELLTYATIKPAINQIENHVFFQQHDAHAYLKESGIQMQGWSPFAAGRNNIFNNETLAGIAGKHNKSIAQVCLRWHYQRAIIAIPRTSQKAHMIENLDIWDFELDQSDLQTIASLDLNTTQFPEWE